MDIRFISSLTADDENTFAPVLLKAVSAILDQMPIAYTIRVETNGGQVFQHTSAAPADLPKRSFESASNGSKLTVHAIG